MTYISRGGSEFMTKKIKARLNTFNYYIPLLSELIIRDIKLKYRKSFLGYLWSILSPLMTMSIMLIVFSNIFRFDIEHYAVYLIIGQIVFNYISESSNIAMWSITSNAALLKKTYVPKYIFTFSKICSSFLNMIFTLGALLIVCLLSQIRINMYMLFIPVILLQVYIFSIGLGLFIAQATVFFRDIKYIYTAFLTAWMYATPIFYPIKSASIPVQVFIRYFNPLYSYITQFRLIVLEGVFPDYKLIIYGFVVASVSMLLGSICFIYNQDKFILYI